MGLLESLIDAGKWAASLALGSFARTGAGQYALRKLLNRWLESELKGTAKVLELKVDPKKKKISVKVDLAGEPEPVIIEVTKYSLREGVFTLEEIEVSRPWMDVLAQKFLAGQEFEIPEEIGAIINRALA